MTHAELMRSCKSSQNCIAAVGSYGWYLLCTYYGKALVAQETSPGYLQTKHSRKMKQMLCRKSELVSNKIATKLLLACLLITLKNRADVGSAARGRVSQLTGTSA